MKQLILILALLLVGCSYETVNDYSPEMGMGGAGDDMAAKLGWSQSGTLITKNPNAGVKLQVIFPVIDVYTVQFAIARNNSTGAVERPQAEITWTVQGNQIVRRVDVVDGMAISGQAEGVQVRLYDLNVASLSGTAGLAYQGSIAVTRGQRPGTMRPTLVNYRWTGIPDTTTAQVSAGASMVAVIPGNVGVQEFFVGLVSDSGLAVNKDLVNIYVLDETGSTIGLYSGADNVWIPTALGARGIAIQNNSPGAIITTVTYAIDG